MKLNLWPGLTGSTSLFGCGFFTQEGGVGPGGGGRGGGKKIFSNKVNILC